MAELSTLARPYAKAAFEYAAEQGRVDQWAEMLSLLASVTEQEKVAGLLSLPTQSADQLTEMLCQLLGKDQFSDQNAKNGENLISVLAENKRLSLLPQISQQFQSLQAEQKQIVDVEITSAFVLDDQQQAQWAARLRQSLSRDVDISTKVDKGLIGGVHIRAGDLVIDGSVRGKLTKLAEVLNQ